MKSSLLNLQGPKDSPQVAQEHYDLGNDLYQSMLDSHMQYSCGYWQDASTLELAQQHKLDLIARKLQLAPGMRFLDIGGGFGGLARFAAEGYGCEVVANNISRQQVAFARAFCQGFPVRFEEKDYRLAMAGTQGFDRIVAVGMCEHVGHKNLRHFLRWSGTI